MKQKLTELKAIENLVIRGDNSVSTITRTNRQKINEEIEKKFLLGAKSSWDLVS